jgi:Tol biopolymer transport system component
MDLNKRLWVMVFGMVLIASCANLGGPSGEIAYESYQEGNAEIYLLNLDGSDPVNLTDDPGYDGTPAWSPDGTQIAFTSERSGNPEILILDLESGAVRQLTDGGGFNVMPGWEPDGSGIVFTSNRTYRIPVEGGEVEVPDNAKLWAVNLDGRDAARLTGGYGMDLYGTYAPDGKSIAFMSVRDENPEIYILGPIGPEWNLTEDEAPDLNPDWSPDGSKLAYMSSQEGNLEIYITDPVRGGERVNISNHPANDGDPAWSPDGKWIAFTSDRDGNVELYIMRADGSGVRRLTETPEKELHPQWRPTGK